MRKDLTVECFYSRVSVLIRVSDSRLMGVLSLQVLPNCVVSQGPFLEPDYARVVDKSYFWSPVNPPFLVRTLALFGRYMLTIYPRKLRPWYVPSHVKLATGAPLTIPKISSWTAHTSSYHYGIRPDRKNLIGYDHYPTMTHKQLCSVSA
jgi:hypothetical protein